MIALVIGITSTLNHYAPQHFPTDTYYVYEYCKQYLNSSGNTKLHMIFINNRRKLRVNFCVEHTALLFFIEKFQIFSMNNLHMLNSIFNLVYFHCSASQHYSKLLRADTSWTCITYICCHRDLLFYLNLNMFCFNICNIIE